MVQDMVVIILGSSRDEEFIKPLCLTLSKFGIHYEQRISSAHKTPDKLLGILKQYNTLKSKIVFITVAGRSNALSGFIDANTHFPVIACPPPSDNFTAMDIFSSLRMPSGVSPMVVLEPENAALAAAKILALKKPEINDKILAYQQDTKRKIQVDDEKLKTRR